MTEGIDTVIVAFASDAVIEASVGAAQPLSGHLVVVDHGDGRSARLAGAMGAIVSHDPSNPGFGAGQNFGFSRTSSRYVLLCNPDAVIEASAIRDGAQFLDAHPDVAAVQGVILNQASGAPERSCGVELGPIHLVGRAVGARWLLGLATVRELVRRSRRLRDHADRIPNEAVETETLAATALLIRRSAFEAVRGFDAGYFLYGEDLDLCRRLRAAGWTLVAMPSLWAIHQSGASAASPLARERYWWGGTMRYAARWWPTGQWTVAFAAAVARAARLSVRAPFEARLTWSSVVMAPMRERLSRSAAS